MELEDFIRESLEAIYKGVNVANANLHANKEELNPFILMRGGGDKDTDRYVEFDIE